MLHIPRCYYELFICLILTGDFFSIPGELNLADRRIEIDDTYDVLLSLTGD